VFEDSYDFWYIAAVQRRYVDWLRILFRKVRFANIFLEVLRCSCYAKLVLVVVEDDEKGCLVREVSVGEGSVA
jgi:hypothetical protein